jgi:oligopeptide/dipeptide ABC transporter ATP-binding protein
VSAPPLIEARGVSKRFALRGRGLFAPHAGTVHAVEDVSLAVHGGETVALVGESGSGKTTLARMLGLLHRPDAGSVHFDGENVESMNKHDIKRLRRNVQIIFQDPQGSLNPRMTVATIISEPLRIHRIGDRRGRAETVRELMDAVGLSADLADRYPHEFSGGQRQRVGIARAIALKPKLIICDEPVSALDVSIQSQILLLLQKLQDSHRLSFVFISHDLGVVRYFCQRMAVMYLGRIVEVGPIPAIFTEPLHPYTRILRDASPVPDPSVATAFAKIEGEVPSAVDPPSGCHFHPRCPFAMARCREIFPAWRQLEDGRGVACHLFDDQGASTERAEPPAA